MPRYQPTTIAYQESGLIKDRQQFVTPNDAYVDLNNAYVWRGIVKRRLAPQFLGRLRRLFSSVSYFDTGASAWSFNLLTEKGYVSAIDLSAAPVLVITCSYAHGLSNGDSVVFSGVGGTIELNTNTYIVGNVTATTFEVTQAGASVFTSGGFWYSDRSLATREPDANLECGGFTMVVGGQTITDDGAGTLTGTGGESGTINYATGAVVLTHAHGAGVATVITTSYFPSLPAMGIQAREISSINEEDTLYFDTRYAYQYSSSSQNFSEVPSTEMVSWFGTDFDFFWSSNYWFNGAQQKYFWVTNGYSAGTVATSDPIRYYDGTTWNATDFYPALKSTGGGFLVTAKIVIPYRGRLVALNTYESVAVDPTTTATLQHPNRARWSQNGDPTNIAATATGGWVDDVQGHGGFVDAPTNENIVSAAFIRDTLIVFFERSTFRLRYSGNEVLPFVWERINIELGADSRFSAIQFDGGVLAVSDKGIITCDGNNAKRIDEPIRDEVFKIHNGNNGVFRVHGIRNFFEQVVYWTFPAESTNTTFPNRILIYNYDNDTWAFTRDHFTVLGGYQSVTDTRWSDLVGTNWQDYKVKWTSGRIQSLTPQIAGGNQQGYIHILNSSVADPKSLFISAITIASPAVVSCPSHNMETGDIIEINGIQETGSVYAALNGFRYQITVVTADSFSLSRKPRFAITAMTAGTTTSVTAAGNQLNAGDLVQFSGITGATTFNDLTATVTTAGNTFVCDLDSSAFPGTPSGGEVENLSLQFEEVNLTGSSTYVGCGEITRINGFNIKSKKFNLLNKGSKTQLGYLDFLVDRTTNGQVSVPIYSDYNSSQRINPKGNDSFFNWGINTTPLELNSSTENEDKVMHRLYCPVEAQFFQYEITLDEDQLISKEIQASGFQLNAIIVWHEVGGRLVR